MVEDPNEILQYGGDRVSFVTRWILNSIGLLMGFNILNAYLMLFSLFPLPAILFCQISLFVKCEKSKSLTN
ncbi:hypothetical protein EUTSA_v10026731mg [Eutrema salsugineum]|uniref:Uncharacterized protein n=1 Tax=Eutrema salsugineum TaxID=72664 RepID=V4MQY7_EUTSA|nr:hypothetical protein EUTSA_v10026731mg [Eutrema salsugineum]